MTQTRAVTVPVGLFKFLTAPRQPVGTALSMLKGAGCPYDTTGIAPPVAELQSVPPPVATSPGLQEAIVPDKVESAVAVAKRLTT